MKKIFFVLIFFYVADGNSQSLNWLRTFGSATGFGFTGISSVSAKENVLVAGGSFQSSVDFNVNGGNPFMLISDSFASQDGFISVYDTSGLHYNTYQIGGNGFDGISKVIFTGNEIYAIGFFEDTCDFDPGPGQQSEIANGFMGDPFILKLDGSGNFIWVKVLHGTQSENIMDFTIDPAQNLYLFGDFTAAIDLDPGPDTAFFYAQSSQWGFRNDCFLLKLDSAGNYKDNIIIGGVGEDYAGGINYYNDHLYVTGGFQDNVDFDPDPGTTLLLNGPVNSMVSSDIFVAQYNASNLRVNWAKHFGNLSSVNYGYKVHCLPDSNVVVTGSYEDTWNWSSAANPVYLNPPIGGLGNHFILNLTDSGNLNWVKSFYLFSGQGNGIIAEAASDSSGNLYFTGVFAGNTDFDPDPFITHLETTSVQSVFLVSLTSAGNFRWGGSLEGPGFAGGSDVMIYENDLYAAGNFSDTLDFDIGPAVFKVGTQTGALGSDADGWLMKMSSGILQSVRENTGSAIRIYPNPVDDFLNIDNRLKIPLSAFTVCNLYGSVVLKGNLSESSNGIQLPDLPAGIYFLNLDSEGKILRMPFIKI